MRVVWSKKEEGSPRRKSTKRAHQEVRMGCTQYANGFKECTCDLCIVWHRGEECYFGDMDPMAREIINTCKCMMRAS